jgi:SAM-dependent methyltransferase
VDTVDDPRRRFTGAGGSYARYRPGYPAPLVDWLLERARVGPGEPVADVGCGTGIFTRLLAARGVDVVGIDPNQDMLAQAIAAGGARYRLAEAAASGFDSHSLALVTVAQAFHWLDRDPALDEFGRILRPGARVAAVYNLRGESGFMDAYDALLRAFSDRYGVVDSWEDTLAALRADPRTCDHEEWHGPSAQRFDFEGLRGRAWTSSYVFQGVHDGAGFDRALRKLFDAHAEGGTIEFPYRSLALLFRLAPGPRA